MGLSGFVGAPGKKLQGRIDRDLTRLQSRTEVVTARSRQLPDVLRENDISEIHFLSLDTQGEEPGILRTLQGDSNIFIHVIDVECNYRSDRAGLVAAAGPAFAPVMLHRFDLFLINRRSPFYARRWAFRQGSTQLGDWPPAEKDTPRFGTNNSSLRLGYRRGPLMNDLKRSSAFQYALAALRAYRDTMDFRGGGLMISGRLSRASWG